MTQEEFKRRARRKLGKWALFAFGLVLLIVLGDYLVELTGPNEVTLSSPFEKGELFILSLGLLIGSVGDLLFDRIFAPTPDGAKSNGWRPYHLILAIFCLFTCLLASVAYGSTRARIESGTSSPGRVVTLSLIVFAAALLLSAVSTVLSEREGKP